MVPKIAEIMTLVFVHNDNDTRSPFADVSIIVQTINRNRTLGSAAIILTKQKAKKAHNVWGAAIQSQVLFKLLHKGLHGEALSFTAAVKLMKTVSH